MDGNVVEWQNWRLHVALHPVDGLMLGDIRYRDGDTWRQVLTGGLGVVGRAHLGADRGTHLLRQVVLHVADLV